MKKATNFERPLSQLSALSWHRITFFFSLISLARLIIIKTTKHQPLKKLFHDAVRFLQLLPHH